MAQQEIIKLLEKNKEMTAGEIAKELEITWCAAWKNLRGLLKEFEVGRRILTKEEAEKLGKKFTGRNQIWFLYSGEI